MSWKGDEYTYGGSKGLKGDGYGSYGHGGCKGGPSWAEQPTIQDAWSSSNQGWSISDYACPTCGLAITGVCPTHCCWVCKEMPGRHGNQCAQMPLSGSAAAAGWQGKGSETWAAEAWESSSASQGMWPSPSGSAVAWQVGTSVARRDVVPVAPTSWAPPARTQVSQAHSTWMAEEADTWESWREEVRVKREEVYDPVVESIDVSNPWGNFTGTKNMPPEREQKIGPGARIKEAEQPQWESSSTSLPAQTWPQPWQQAWSQPGYQQSSDHGNSARSFQRPGRKVDPEDKVVRNFTEVYTKYSHFFSEKEVLEYWDNTCKPVDDTGEAAWNSQNGAESSSSPPWKNDTASPPEETKRATEMAAPPQADTAEKRLDPEDNKERTYDEILKKYSHFFKAAEVEEYWERECKPIQALEEKLTEEEKWVQEGTHKKPEEKWTGDGQWAHDTAPAKPEDKCNDEEAWVQEDAYKEPEEKSKDEEQQVKNEASEAPPTEKTRPSAEQDLKVMEDSEMELKDQAENGWNENKEEQKIDAAQPLLQKVDSSATSESAAQIAAQKARHLLEAHKKRLSNGKYLSLLLKEDSSRFDEWRLDPCDGKIRNFEKLLEYYKPYMRDLEQLKSYWDEDCRPIKWVECSSDDEENAGKPESKTDARTRSSADMKNDVVASHPNDSMADADASSGVADHAVEQASPPRMKEETSTAKDAYAARHEANTQMEHAVLSPQKRDSAAEVFRMDDGDSDAEPAEPVERTGNVKQENNAEVAQDPEARTLAQQSGASEANSSFIGGLFNKIMKKPDKPDGLQEGEEREVIPTKEAASDESPEDVAPF